jgi:hypothetical protein
VGKKVVRYDSPAEIVIRAFGGTGATAAALGMAPSSVSLWKMRGGEVPAKRWKQVLKVAKAKGIVLTMDHVMNGGVWTLGSK